MSLREERKHQSRQALLDATLALSSRGCLYVKNASTKAARPSSMLPWH